MNKLLLKSFKKSTALGLLHLAIARKSKIWIKGQRTRSLFNLFPEISNWQMWGGDSRDLLFLNEQDLLLLENPSVDELWKIGSYCEASVVITMGSPLDESLADGVLSEEEIRSGLLSCKSYLASSVLVSEETLNELHFGGPRRRPGLFLDRDGVVLKFVDYLKHHEQVELDPGICRLIQTARQKGYAVVIVTNQSGIGRGLFAWEEYDLIQQKVLELLALGGVTVDLTMTAVFWSQSENLNTLVGASLRKPRPGMVISAAKQLGIDLKKSILVGDSATDIQMADVAGFKNAYIYNSHSRVEKEIEKLKSWPLRGRSHWGNNIAMVKSLTEIEL